MRISQNINQNNNCSFKSKIDLVDSNKFRKVFEETKGLFKFVDAPYTQNEIQKGERVMTQEIRSCTAGGIITKTKEGIRDVVMFHLNPDEKESQNFQNVMTTLLKKIGDSTPLNALVVGSKNTADIIKYGGEYFDNLLNNVIKKFNIPVSILKGSPMGGKDVDIFYNGTDDAWYVWNLARDDISPNNASARKTFTGFKETIISPADELQMD